MDETSYPSVDEALYLHARLLERFGGAPGVRDLGLLESALARPRSGYYADLFEQAAALLQSLALNHCFIDGNKRVAFALSLTFLRVHGLTLRVSPDEGERFVLDDVILDKAELTQIASWLEARAQR